jgi:hypothetical protein
MCCPTGAFSSGIIYFVHPPIGWCLGNSITSIIHCRAALVPREIFESLSSIHRNIYNIRPQLLARSHPRNSSRPPSDFRIPVTLFVTSCDTLCQVPSVHFTWAGVDSVGTRRDRKSHLELGNSWGLVRPIYIHSVRAPGITGWDCMSPAITVNNSCRPWSILSYE